MRHDNGKNEHHLKLTLAVYRVTELFFKEGEDLKWQIRESANKILADFILLNHLSSHPNPSIHSHITPPNQIEKIIGLFEEAKAKNWVDSRNFLVLRREYDKIQQLRKIRKNSGKTVENPLSNSRQEKIKEVLMSNEKLKLGDLIQFFPQLHRRTLIRDLEKLCRAGVALRNGNGRGIYYTRNGQER